MINFKVSKEEQGQRVDKYLRKNLSKAPLSLLYKVFRKKDVKVNGKRVHGEYVLSENDEISVYISDEFLDKYTTPKTSLSLPKAFKVIYEDENIIIVDKPSGLSLHADEIEQTNTLANQVLAYTRRNGGSEVTAPAHRLDRNTSGLVIFGKDMESLHELNEMFKTRVGIKKCYLALTFNELKEEKVINLPLLKDEKKKLVVVSKDGLNAKSIAKPVLTNKDYSLVEVELLTGRTHQIRVHLSSVGFPIVGDQKYGDFTKNKTFGKEFNVRYQFLHAYKIKFEGIEGKLAYLNGREFVSDLPKSKQAVIDKIFNKQ